MRLPRPLLNVLLASALVVGCGGGDDDAKSPAEPKRLSAASYSKRLDAARKDFLKTQVGPIDPTQLGTQADRARESARAYQRLAGRLRRLSPPERIDTAHRRYTLAIRGLVQANEGLAQAGDAGTSGLAFIGQRAQEVADAGQEAKRARISLDEQLD